MISTILDNDERVQVGSWKSPAPQSPYFGWMDSEGGLVTVRVDQVAVVCPSGRNDKMQITLVSGQSMMIPVADGLRLMKRFGWTEGSRVV